MLATAEQIIDTWNKSPGFHPNIRYALGLPTGAQPTITYVDKMLERVMERIDDNQMGKGVRPWEIVDVTSKLDPEQCWIGIEFETGFDSRREYSATMNYLWRHHENNAVDYEGCGDYPCEITFSPVNMEDFHKPSYNMDRLLKWLDEKGFEQGDRGDPDDDAVGIHVNISTPALRANRHKCASVAECLSATLDGYDWKTGRYKANRVDCQKFFKRQPYGYFEDRSSADGKVWIEGKLFNSTHSMDDWEEYKITINNLALLMEHLASVDDDTLQCAITNMDAILAGEIDAHDVEFDDSSVDDDDDHGEDW